MCYREISQRILDYFLRHNTFGDRIFLAISSKDLEGCVPGYTFSILAKQIYSYWQFFPALEGDRGEQVFGIIALQMALEYGDYTEGSSDDDSEKGFLVAVEKVLGCSAAQCQNLFYGKRHELGQTFQDQLWARAKSFLAEKYGLILTIPPPKRSIGRFVQYIRSQLLLRYEELACFSELFVERGLLPPGVLTHEFIQQHIFQDWGRIRNQLPPRAVRILENDANSIASGLFSRQLQQFHADWDGRIYHYEPSSQSVRVKFGEAPYTLVAEWCDDGMTLYKETVSDGHTEYADISAKEATSAHLGGFLLLQPRRGYSWIYEQCQHLDISSPLLVIYQPANIRDIQVVSVLSLLCNKTDEDKRGRISSDVRFLHVDLAESFINALGPSCFRYRNKGLIEAHITLQYGASVGYRKYLPGAGPDILVPVGLSARLYCVGNTHQQLDTYDPRTAPPGYYVLTCPDQPRVTFEIMPPSTECLDSIEPWQGGWHYASWSWVEGDDYDIQGALLGRSAAVSHQISPAREWMATQIDPSGQVSPQHLLAKTIKRNYYGYH